MPETDGITDVKATLGQVAAMLEEMRSRLSILGEDQALWVPPGEDVWPVQRSAAHCVNCEHRAVSELERALNGQPTPQTIPADTAILAWFGPTPYALARLVDELKCQIEKLSDSLDESHLDVKAVRYPNHPPRMLIDYVKVMHQHTGNHLAAIRRKMTSMPPSAECDPQVRQAYPDFGRGAAETQTDG